MRNINSIVVHHSASHWGCAEVFREWHLERGWQDIGYHCVVNNGYINYKSWASRRSKSGWLGAVEAGRPLALAGAHCPGLNQESIGIVCVGNYMVDKPPVTVWNALVAQCAFYCVEFDIDPDRIFYHRDRRATACPGRRFNSRAILRAQVRDKIDDSDGEVVDRIRPRRQAPLYRVVLNDKVVGAARGRKCEVADHSASEQHGRKVFVYVK